MRNAHRVMGAMRMLACIGGVTALTWGAGLRPAHAQVYNVFDLGTLGGTTSSAAGINDAGQITGVTDITGNSAGHAFLWTSGGTGGPISNPQMKDLGTLGGANSSGGDLNLNGQVVGSAQNGIGSTSVQSRPFL